MDQTNCSEKAKALGIPWNSYFIIRRGVVHMVAGFLHPYKDRRDAFLGASSHESLPQEHVIWDVYNLWRGGGWLIAENFKARFSLVTSSGDDRSYQMPGQMEEGHLSYSLRIALLWFLLLVLPSPCSSQWNVKSSQAGFARFTGLTEKDLSSKANFFLLPWLYLSCQWFSLFSLTLLYIRTLWKLSLFWRIFNLRSRQHPFRNFLLIWLPLTSAIWYMAGGKAGVGAGSGEAQTQRKDLWGNKAITQSPCTKICAICFIDQCYPVEV